MPVSFHQEVSSVEKHSTKGLLRGQKRAFFLFIAPAVFLVGLFCLYPLLNTFYLSFHKYNAASGINKTFSGFGNFTRLLTNDQFLNSLKVTLVYTSIGVASTMILGVGLALLLNRKGFIIRLLRGISLMPMLICGVALTVAWQLLYNANFGLFNIILESLRLPSKNWLGDVNITLYALALTDTWQFTPFVMILTLAGMQSISTEYYEAAAIDGASRVQMFSRITLPLLKNVLLTILIMRIIDTFKTFEKPYIMANKGGPLRSTELLTVFVYKQSFERWEYGIGATGSMIVAILIAVLSLVIIKISRLNTDEG
jgi:multiple sugar transport system permease protein